MLFIDPHAHMISRTTDDYQAMAAAGIVAVIEPAFWLGQPRTNVGSYIDYLSTIVGWERFRAAQFGIRHYCAVGLNAKEANNEALAEEEGLICRPLFGDVVALCPPRGSTGWARAMPCPSCLAAR